MNYHFSNTQYLYYIIYYFPHPWKSVSILIGNQPFTQDFWHLNIFGIYTLEKSARNTNIDTEQVYKFLKKITFDAYVFNAKYPLKIL